MTEALVAVRTAMFVFDDAERWSAARADGFGEPLAVETWIFDESLKHVLLVAHRWRGWVPPGGAVDPSESPRVAAMREVQEEVGLSVDLLDRPAATCVRSYRSDWSLTLGLSFAAVADMATALTPEPDQPARWTSLSESWESAFADDRSRMTEYVYRLRNATQE